MNYEERLALAKRKEIEEATKTAAGSGAVYGGVAGGLASLLSGERSIPKMALKAALGAAGGSALSGGSTYLGSEIMGPPEDDEDNAFTSRGGLGGGLAGGALGLGVGALLGSGKLRMLAKIPGAGKVAEAVGAHEHGLFNNLITDKLAKWARESGAGSTAKSAAALGLGGAAGGAYWGGGEGMQLDTMRDLLRTKAQRDFDEEDL